MKIQYASDFHLEMGANREFLLANPLTPQGDILVLAGDIGTFATGIPLEFMAHYSPHYEAIYWVPGNHEYYCSLADKAVMPRQELIYGTNCFLVNNVALVHAGVNLIFSTLWSQIEPENEQACESGVNDFRLIEYTSTLTGQERRLNSHNFNHFHHQSLAFIKSAIVPEMKNVVITHHVPTMQNYPPHYVGSKINNVFAVELAAFITTAPLQAWIYGHSHWNTKPFTLGGTEMLTNQLGYVQLNEHHTFNPAATLEV